MRRAVFSAMTSALLALAALYATPAFAQRVFVSAQGSDDNPCSFALPCRTFQHAHDTVAARGEIDVLDPAGYGPMTITKPVSIQGHGFAGISVTGNQTGIFIQAGNTGPVSLNGLVIEGSAGTTTGIEFGSGTTLTVENCVIRNMSSNAIAFFPTDPAGQKLSVSNSYFSGNRAPAILVESLGSGIVTAAIRQVTFSNNAVAVDVGGAGGTGPINVTVTDAIVNVGDVPNASQVGFSATSAAGHSVVSLVLTRTLVTGSATAAIEAFGTNATIRLAQSSITGNGTGYKALNGGVILSYGDNVIARNGSNTGVLGSATTQ